MSNHFVFSHKVSRFIAKTVACVVGITTMTLTVTAQCMPAWLPGSGVPGIAIAEQAQYGKVFASAVWDADGVGGQAPVLVVAGEFSIAGDSLVNNIAVWNGSSWSTLGNGFNDDVFALTVYNGQLIAGGEFTASGATTLGRIARWNGSAWAPLSSTAIKDMNNGSVRAMTIYNSNLVVGGDFTQVTSATDNFKRIAQWDGSSWTDVSNTAVGGINDGRVLALAVYGGNLIAGGSFNQVDSTTDNFIGITKWNGAAWSAVKSGAGEGLSESEFTGPVNVTALAVYGGNLIAGGQFEIADSTKGIAKWNGSSWSGLSNTAGEGIEFGIEALMVHNGHLIVSGGSMYFQNDANPFTTDDFIGGLVSWNGSAWDSSITTPSNIVVSSLSTYNGELLIGGVFTDLRPASGNAYGIARWDGSMWHALVESGSNVTDGVVFGMRRLANGEVGVAGVFTRLEGLTTTYVASVTGEFADTSAIGTGLSKANSLRPADYLEHGLFGSRAIMQMPAGSGVLAGKIFAGGVDFAATNNGVPQLIAQSNGTTWSPLSTPLVTMDDAAFGILGHVNALLAMPNGDLIAGGRFFLPGDAVPIQVARWDGSTWTPLMSESPGSSLPEVFAMGFIPQTGELIVGGDFQDIGANPGTRHIVRWDGVSTNGDGTAVWEAMGRGATGGSGGVRAIQVMPSGEVIVGGTLLKVANTVNGLPVTVQDTNGIASWNPSTDTWSSLAQGLRLNPTVGTGGIVYALTLMADGTLAVGGEFKAANNGAAGIIPANNIAIWNPGTMRWSSLGDGVSGRVFSLATTADGTLLVGGEFGTAGGQISAHLARWGCGATACRADFNGVNGVTVQDIFDFLTAWLAGNPSANFNGVNGVTVQDIFDFLTAWLAGC